MRSKGRIDPQEYWQCRYCGAKFKDMVELPCRECRKEHVMCKPCRSRLSVPEGSFPKYRVLVRTCPPDTKPRVDWRSVVLPEPPTDWHSIEEG